VTGLSDPVHQNKSTEVLIEVSASLLVQSYFIMLIMACYALLYMFWALYIIICNSGITISGVTVKSILWMPLLTLIHVTYM
jgi:hypothetical protein